MAAGRTARSATTTVVESIRMDYPNRIRKYLSQPTRPRHRLHGVASDPQHCLFAKLLTGCLCSLGIQSTQGEIEALGRVENFEYQLELVLTRIEDEFSTQYKKDYAGLRNFVRRMERLQEETGFAIAAVLRHRRRRRQ